MDTIQPNNNKVPCDVSLTDVLNLWKKDVMLSLNCHAIATITAFDTTNQTVQAQINYAKTYSTVDPLTGVYISTQVNYPALVDCPAIVLGAGKSSLTFPIQKGDQALILFNDRDMDNWFAGATGGSPATSRLHSLSDGIALVGLNRLSDYDTTRVALNNDKAHVALGPELVKIYNEVTTLKTILNNLITAIGAMTVSPGSFMAGGNPVSGSGTVSGVSSITSQVNSLLE